MKTTIQISDELVAQAKAFAARERTTLRVVIEQGIRLVLREARSSKQFRLRDASVGGNGLQAEFVGSDWARVRDAAYRGRGS
ncbi:MAG: DUF2191 domain-containing protein [Alphaproteobacteria bacterium]|nr:DUF2191 domain-containing protein [Alphaproteobacteria bacterium]